VHSVREATVEDEDSGESYRTLMLVLNPLHSKVKQVFAHVLHADDQARYDARLAWFGDKAREIKSEARRYCITVHRSQGSTYKRAFVDVVNILENKTRSERQSLLYVAYSRPSQTLATNKSKYVA
jgi:hypothetical protein